MDTITVRMSPSSLKAVQRFEVDLVDDPACEWRPASRVELCNAVRPISGSRLAREVRLSRAAAEFLSDALVNVLDIIACGGWDDHAPRKAPHIAEDLRSLQASLRQ